MNETIDTLTALAAALSPHERDLLLEALGASATPTRAAASTHGELALIGVGCKLPGAIEDAAGLWAALVEGRDAVDRIPAQRWDADAHFSPNPEDRGRAITRYGAFMAEVEGFDPRPFELTEVEAGRMDPQQRLLLEVCHEALEDAGLAADRLRGGAVGVFVGSCGHDFEALRTGPADVHTLTGVLSSVLAGRVSHAFGFTGPSLVVDTACSSSLVALHLARESLLRGECELALVAGINLMLSPAAYERLSRARALSADGRCRTFDARASGYARGEGVAAVVLRRLDDARAHRDRVRARVVGSAINHDGRSASLTAPSEGQQRAVLAAALASVQPGGLSPAAIDYVEAHGTGTPLGDPIEVQALRAVLGQRERPCVLGSIKTNLGHLEGAAGIVGLIKVALSLEHEAIPRHLHFEQLNPRIDLGGVFEIPRATRPWPRGERPRYAGVSAFGISGTNAHVILREAPVDDEAAAPARETPVVLPLAAHDPQALAALLERYAALLDQLDPLDPLDVAALQAIVAAAARRRAQAGLRLAVSGRDPRALAAALRQTPIPAEPGGERPRVLALRDPSFDEVLARRWASWGVEAEAVDLRDRAAIETARADGATLAVAIGGRAPQASRAALLARGVEVLDGQDLDALLAVLAVLHRRGVEIDWAAVYPGAVAHRELPRYPWQRRRFPLAAALGAGDEPPRDTSPGLAVDDGPEQMGTPLRLATAPALRLWSLTVGPAREPSPARFVSAALAAARLLGRPAVLADLEFAADPSLGGARTLQLIADLDTDRLELFVLEGEDDWRRWASARLATPSAGPAPTPSELQALRERGVAHRAEAIDAKAAAGTIEAAPVLSTLWEGEDQLLADLALATSDERAAIDAALQLAVADLQRGLRGRVKAIATAAVVAGADLSRARWVWRRTPTGDVAILDADDRVLAWLSGCAIEAPAPAAASPDPTGADAPTIPADPEQLSALVIAATREILGLDPKLRIPPDQDLRELGMDSLLSFELADRVSDLLGVRLDDGFAADYPSVGAMVQALVEMAEEQRR